MKNFIGSNGRAIGGLFGIATAAAMYFGFKTAGISFMLVAVILVVASESMRKK